MAKISPVSIKYMIHANFIAEGALEKPDVIGAIFGQTEGLLGAELEMRELQKEGKIGRIEVDLERKDKRTVGNIKIPTALDQSETTLIAAAIETIERIGPSDSQIEIERIEDVRGSKRDYILERAKKLMSEIKGSTDSREISNEIKDSAKTSNIQEYGDEKLPCGNISGREIIVVEGRADVVNLLRAGVTNVIAMNGTKLPNAIKELGKEKEITLFVDGDRGGRLIIQNVTDNANIDYIVVAPDGKEVEELAGKEILMILRRKTPLNEFLKREGMQKRENGNENNSKIELSEENKEKLKRISKEIEGSGKAIILDDSLKEVKEISARGLGISLKRLSDKPKIIVLDGTVTGSILESAEEAGCQIIVAKNFAATSNKIQLLSF
ncbi:MAG TPA: DNA primase DnaG [Candidatus Pacearchaeota archaeon]|nr:DNA primase DnaG [Candidatus Pacearchaeota archaeon]